MPSMSGIAAAMEKALDTGALEDWYLILPDRKHAEKWKMIYYATGREGGRIERRKYDRRKRLKISLSAEDVDKKSYREQLRKFMIKEPLRATARVVVLDDYTPTPRQWAYHANDADELLYGGAAGGGKSAASVMDALYRCLDWPGTTAYLFRRSYPELEDTLIKEALQRIPRSVGWYSVANHIMHLCNGSRLVFRYCESERDVTRYQGAEIQWLYFDEMTHFPKAVYDYLNTRKRAPKGLRIDERLVTRGASNPGGIGHGWVKNMFVSPAPKGGEWEEHREVTNPKTGEKLEKDLKIAFVPATVWDNDHIGEDYIFELDKKPNALREALMNGSWDAFEGQVFVEWRDDPTHYMDRRYTHVIDPFDIPAWWPRWRSFDFGFSHPFSIGWWTVAPDGRIYRYREWYGGSDNVGLQLPVQDIARGIIEAERAHEAGIRVYGIADPSIWDGSRGESVAAQMEREGVYFEPATNDRIPGKMEIHNRLRWDAEGLPGMQVFSTCRDFIRTMPALVYSQRRVEDVDTDGEDHIYDETRYIMMRHPMGKTLREECKYIPGRLDPLDQLRKTKRR